MKPSYFFFFFGTVTYFRLIPFCVPSVVCITMCGMFDSKLMQTIQCALEDFRTDTLWNYTNWRELLADLKKNYFEV